MHNILCPQAEGCNNGFGIFSVSFIFPEQQIVQEEVSATQSVMSVTAMMTSSSSGDVDDLAFDNGPPPSYEEGVHLPVICRGRPRLPPSMRSHAVTERRDSTYAVTVKKTQQLQGFILGMGFLTNTQNCGLRMHRECRERFPRHRGLAILTWITARAWGTCREAYRDR